MFFGNRVIGLLSFEIIGELLLLDPQIIRDESGLVTRSQTLSVSFL